MTIFSKDFSDVLLREFDDSEPRDEQGRWANGGGGGTADNETGSASSSSPDRPALDALLGRVGQPDGGFSYNPKTKNEPTTGYAVSIHPDRSEGMAPSEVTADRIAQFVTKNQDLFSQDGKHVGAWHDPESGQVFLDVSHVVKDEQEAEKLALGHDQIAYYDFVNGRSVTVNANATSGGAAKKSYLHWREFHRTIEQAHDMRTGVSNVNDRTKARTDPDASERHHSRGHSVDGGAHHGQAADRGRLGQGQGDAGAKYSEEQPRDENGRWTDGSGTGNDASAEAGSQSGRAGSESAGASGTGGLSEPGRVGSGTGRVELPGEAAAVAAGHSAEPLAGAPKTANVPGLGKVAVQPSAAIRQAAAEYCKAHGIEYNPPKDYVKVDPERATRIAQAYEDMKHAPDDPEVKAAYEQLAVETIDQYKAAIDAGLQVEFIDYAKQGDPYAASPRLAIEDIQKNNHMWVFPTDAGFGSNQAFDASQNPLLADTGLTISGKPACVNDLFRVVHDYYGHAKEGNGMRAQPLSAKVLTPNGWKLMGELKIGDAVANPLGDKSVVTAIHPRGVQRVWRIIFNDGTETRASGDHRWRVRWAKDENWQTKTTDQLRKLASSCSRRLTVPIAESLELGYGQSLPLDPYILGVILGDGHIQTQVSFYSDDSEIAERVAQRLPPLVSLGRRASKNEYRFTTGKGSISSPVNEALKALGLWGTKAGNKFVPAVYKFTSFADRLELLRGLMDTDGGVASKKTTEFTLARFRSISLQLANDVAFLVRSLGGIARISVTDECTYQHKGKAATKQRIYTVGLNLRQEVNPFHLSRKADRWIRKNEPARAIKEIVEAESEEVQCITVSSPNHLYITDDFIVTMNCDGEENAWRSHSAMFTDLARRAMTSETRGQNSWVNYGPHAAENQAAKGSTTHYADQKVGLMPEWVMDEGAKSYAGFYHRDFNPDQPRDPDGRFASGGGGSGGSDDSNSSGGAYDGKVGYSDMGTSHIDVAENGQIKLKQPKDTKEAIGFLDAMEKIYQTAHADLEAAEKLPASDPNRGKAFLRHDHALRQFNRAVSMSKKLLPKKDHDAKLQKLIDRLVTAYDLEPDDRDDDPVLKEE